MISSRQKIFITFEQLDRWVEEARVELFADRLTFKPEGWAFRLLPACWFTQESAKQLDAEGLLGKVKTHEAIEAMGGDIAHGTVIIREQAYDVVDGYMAEPVPQTDADNVQQRSGGKMASAGTGTRDLGVKPRKTDLDLLARLFSGQGKR